MTNTKLGRDLYVTHLLDMECSRATGEATMIAGLSSRSIPLLHRASPRLLRCLLSRVRYVRFSPLESLSPHREIQHVLLQGERTVTHLQAVDPLEEVAAHLRLPLHVDEVKNLWKST